MAFGLPQISYMGFPLAVPCAGHAGVGFRRAVSHDAPALMTHFMALTPEDRRMRFCATLDESAIRRHVDGLWSRNTLVLAAHDGPLWTGPLYAAGRVCAVAELALDGAEAELAISVDPALRRRGVGTYLVQAAARLIGPRGVRRIGAYTLPGNRSFLALARACDAAVEHGPDEVEVTFDVAALRRAYRQRRASDYLLRAG